MTDIYVATLDWTGTYGHEGISKFAFVTHDGGVPTNTQRDAELVAIMSMINTNAGGLPTDLSWDVNPIIESFDGVTGAITGELPAAAAIPPQHGIGTGPYANGVGLTLKWKTGGMFRGRRTQGRTFVVPLNGTQFTADGFLQPEAVAGWQLVANDYLAAVNAAGLTPLVWGRPADVLATARTPAHHNPGHWSSINTAVVNNMPAILGRRR